MGFFMYEDAKRRTLSGHVALLVEILKLKHVNMTRKKKIIQSKLNRQNIFHSFSYVHGKSEHCKDAVCKVSDESLA